MNASDTDEPTLIMRRADHDDGTPRMAPEDLREWVSAVRLVKLIRELVARLPPKAVPNPDASHLAAVLLWGWATGRHSSWDIAALCEEEPLCRYLAGSTRPRRVDLRRYRRDREEILRTTLADLLKRVAPESKSETAVSLWIAEAASRQQRTVEADREGPPG